MHYYIDGYNLLFRFIHSPKDLQSEREELLEDLNQKACKLGLDITIVFDAIHQTGGRTRAHFNALEIIYTAEGETADEYIIDAISQIPNPRAHIVVTNDKTLAYHVRHFSGKVETIEEFTLWLNRSYTNRLKQTKKIRKDFLPPVLPPPVAAPQTEIIPPPPPQIEKGSVDYYQHIFEAKFQSIQEKVQQNKISKQPLKKVRKPKSRKDPFATSQSPEEKTKNEIERWLRTFEERFNHPEQD